MAFKKKPHKNFLRRQMWWVRRIALHLLLIMLLCIGLLLLLFQVMLPLFTHHGQSITVPPLIGRSLEEVESALAQRGLRLKVLEDTAYLPEYPPLTVLQQHPRAGTQVKQGRKIYLTINSNTAPEVQMPALVDGSVRNAKALLSSNGLVLGQVRYVPDIAQNAVLEQRYEGKTIEPGTLVVKGSKIDLVVGAGLGKQQIAVPDVVGKSLEEAELLLLGVGIKVGHIVHAEESPEGLPGTSLEQPPTLQKKVYKQVPIPGVESYIGGTVDLWLMAVPEVGVTSHEMMMTPDA